MCTTVGVLDCGRLILQERLDTLLRPARLVEVHSPDAAAAATLVGDAVVRLDGDRMLVRADVAADLNRHLVGAGIRVTRLGPY